MTAAHHFSRNLAASRFCTSGGAEGIARRKHKKEA
jgi:hypothetical protein